MENKFIEIASPMGGVLWYGALTGDDCGYSIVKSFIEQYKHDDWTLSIFDMLSESTVEIECELDAIPQIVAFIYNLEHAYPISFIGENPISNSYVIGMTCSRGRLQIPGHYKAENGKLIDLTTKKNGDVK